MSCCDETCIERGYLKMANFPPFQEFKKKIRKFDGVYDDHDYGIIYSAHRLTNYMLCVPINNV